MESTIQPPEGEIICDWFDSKIEMEKFERNIYATDLNKEK